MNILFATSECAPFIKTGGLADVAGALPKALAGNGHDVRVILPLYEGIGEEWRSQMTYLQCFHITLAWRSPYCGIFELKRDGVTYWFVDNEYYFKRSNIYGHYDDGERFAYFSRAVVESMGWLNWHPDVLHCNDWQTALVPIYLLEERHRIPQLCDTKSVFTIHNIEYQGRYGSQTLKDVFGLNDGYFNEHMLAYHGDVNLMKGAIYAADYVTTVSPTYADELQYSFYAHGLEGVIADNRHKLRGILNGIDTVVYDPATDPLYQNYRKQYTREGQRATADALGAAASASGGIPSSYANAAANQASNYYAAQLTDKIPDLYQLAYNQYLNDYNMDLSNLGVVQGAEQLDGTVSGAVSLQALKDLLRVVENHAGRIQGEGLIGDDAGVMPALVRRIVHDEHVVGENLAEAQLALVRGLGLGAGGLGDLNIQHIDRSLKIV